MAGVPESRNRSSATQSSEMRELGTVIVCLLLVTCIQSEEEVSYETEERKPCTYFYSDRVAKPEGGLVNCSWYSNQACCKRTEVTSVFSNIEPLHSATRACRNQLNYLMCFFCSPDQHLWYIDQKLRVCAKYCKSLYEDCRNAGVGNQIIGKEYSNGSAFCEAQNFEVVEGASCFEYDPDVFGIGTFLIPTALYMFVGLLVVLLLK
ncbi:uncharacterized protein LOC112557241 [Pomacea canaliculata]|uniref:uncharacterized protein LOC112557241 n=1 Tax=Pomacea canaliculata TaxID=400727 RepID=UPI000D731A9E|nr:uncharacterized protein LOC112557241 [Pomacea canaliculata]